MTITEAAQSTNPQPRHTDPRIHSSLKHSVRDGAWYSVMTGSGESYFSAFAIFLKATTAQIGFLSSVPTLLASFAQLFSAWLGHKHGKRKTIILIGAGLQALIWLPIMLLPWWFPNYAIELLILCIIFYHAFGNFASPQWSSLMGELVTERTRGRYFARRTAISSMISFIALISAGLLLHHFDDKNLTKIGFMVIFFIAMIGRILSVYHLTRMHDPSGHVASLEMPIQASTIETIKSSPFIRFSLFFMLIYFAVYMASPFFSVYMLRDLKFSYVEFMCVSASAVFFQFIALQRFGRITDIFGNRVVLILCGTLIPTLPLFWLVSTNIYYLIVIQAIGGFVWAGFSLSVSNYLYDLIPSNKRATYMAIHGVLSSTGIFMGALMGGWLGSIAQTDVTLFGNEIQLKSPLYFIFLLSFCLRVIAMLMFLPRIREHRKVRSTPIHRLIFRVIAFQPLTGLKFEVVTSRKSKKSH